MSRAHARGVAAALVLDAAFGEPPEHLHPTVWMGRATSAYARGALRLKSPEARRGAGIVLAVALPGLVWLTARAALSVAPKRLRWALGAALTSTALSLRGLARAAEAVERELDEGRLGDARARVGEFVGRDTAGLSEAEVCRAAVESVAENTSDGVVAPMLYGLLFGPSGALAYRAVNTLDSMVGYRRGPYAELGWASARLDDLANLIPARATVLVAAALSGRPGATLRTASEYGPRASSPNAGWTEAAFAGALGVRLGGSNTYGGVTREGPILGEGPPPGPTDIGRAVVLMRRCCVLLAVAGFLAGEARGG
ncbi:MAG: adenosylcobinamide-phosphate synthase CbiB [Actinomycetota bacterium]|nr:adenosylcobinamide-phosphate synthase CbiB [Actinomycetota bacterium]